MAEKIGCTRATFTKYYNGDNMPSLATFISICKVLDVDFNYFISDNTADANNSLKFSEDVIRALFFLIDNKILFFNKEDNICYINNQYPTIGEVLDESDVYSNSRISGDLKIVESIVKEYVYQLQEDLLRNLEDLPF